jgi:hypothetical protein
MGKLNQVPIFPKITTLPPRIGNFDSKIIKPKLAKIIIKWINKEDFSIARKFYQCYQCHVIDTRQYSAGINSKIN